jgi:hypothetical protein
MSKHVIKTNNQLLLLLRPTVHACFQISVAHTHCRPKLWNKAVVWINACVVVVVVAATIATDAVWFHITSKIFGNC